MSANTVTRKAQNIVLYSNGPDVTNYAKILSRAGQVQIETANNDVSNGEHTVFIAIKGDLRINPDQDISATASTFGFYMGKAQTDGTWRFMTNSNNNLEFQRRINGVWTVRQTLT